MKAKCKNDLGMEKQKSKGGKCPIVLSDEQITELETLAKDMNIEQIADYFDFSEDTFYELKKRDFRVLRAYKKGKARGIKEVTGLLWSRMREGDTNAITFYLENMMVKKVRISFNDTSPEGIFNSGFNALKEGLINLAQMEQIGNLALMKMKIESNELQKSSTGLLEQGMLYNMPKVKMN